MDCYDSPALWDLAFSDETKPEADFLQQVLAHYLKRTTASVLEIGCGGGRQVVEMARRGFDVTAFDLSSVCVAETRRQLKRRKLAATVMQADMADFQLPQQFDLAHCLVNTFRHLITEDAARLHLQSVARSLRPGGLYVLGFHLLPPDALELDCERWTILHGKRRVTTTVRVLDFSRKTRLETVRFSLKVTAPAGGVRLSSDHQLRIYRAHQFRTLLRTVPEFQLLDVYDFCYDLSESFPLNDQLGDAVFILQKP
jgi:SAM-dependent methyltransferase